jgi:hypothetical protein
MSKPDPALQEQYIAMLEWHLTGNLYPPASSIPHYMEFARQAILLVSSGLGERSVIINVDGREGSLFNRKTDQPVSAQEMVDNWRLHDFCGSEQAENSDASEPSQLGDNYYN